MKETEENVKITKEWSERVATSKPFSALGRKFAFYGTLREGQGNWNHLVHPAKDAKKEGVKTLQGYKMYSLGPYPFVVYTGKEDDSVVVELYDIPDEAAAMSIHHMELGAGYGVDEVTIDGVVYWLYVYPDTRNYEGKEIPEVKGGDWVEYKEAERRRKLSDKPGPRAIFGW